MKSITVMHKGLWICSEEAVHQNKVSFYYHSY